MPWNVEYNEALGFIEVVHTGSISEADVRETTVKAIALSNAHGVTKGLIDCSGQTRFEATITDIYELPDHYEKEGLSRRTLHIAYVRSPAPTLQKFAAFYENVCVNRGWHVKSFTNREDAIAWLTNEITGT